MFGKERSGGAESREAGGVDAAELFASEYGRLKSLCTGFLANESDAEDAVQETFARATARLHEVRANPSGYLAAIARNVCRDELRRRRRVVLGAVHADVAGSIEDRVVDREDAGRAISSLGHRDRRVILALANGLSSGEIGHLFGVSADTARQLVSRARRRARLGIERLGATVGTTALPPRIGARQRRFAAGRAMRPWIEPLRELTAAAAPVMVSVAAALGGGGAAMSVPAGGAPVVATSVRPHSAADLAVPARALLHPGQVASVSSSGADVRLSGGDAPPPSPRPHPSGALPIVVSSSADPQQSGIDSLAASPAYSSDHTLFASGVAADGCQQVASCPALFVSSDGGTSWLALAATGWGRCSVTPSPDLAADHVLLGTCANGGAVRSDDGGTTFHPVLPFAAQLIPDGSSPPSDPRVVVIGGSTLSIYHVATQAVSPGPVLASGMLPVAAAVDSGSGDIVVAAQDTAGHTRLVRCHGSLPCQPLATVPSGVTALMLSPHFSSDGTLIVRNGVSASASHDGGVSVAGLPVGAGEVRSTQFAGSQVFAVLRASSGTTSLLVSGDDARSFNAVSGAQPLLAQAYLVVDGGRMLAGLWATQQGAAMGIWCSTDDARSWRRSC